MIRHLFGIGLIGLALPAHAEGTADTGPTQALNSRTLLRVDVLDPSETIFWTGVMTDWEGIDTPVQVEVTGPSGAVLGTYNSGDPIPSLEGAGTYELDPLGLDLWGDPADPLDPVDSGPPDGELDPITTWDVTVDGAAPDRGRLWSLRWKLDSGRFSAPYAMTGSFFGLVDAGDVGRDAVIEMAVSGLTGNSYDVVANGRGATSGAVTANGRSVPLAGWDVEAQHALYLNPPEIASFDAISPVIDAVAFSYDAACGSVASGVVGGLLEFESNVAGTWHLLCDANGDDFYDVSSDDDVHVVGDAMIGPNAISWDGTANDGSPVPAGAYECRVRLTVGEYHFVATDIETAYQGLRMFRVDEDLNRSALPMYWNDIVVQDEAVPMLDGELGLQSSGPLGLDSGDYDLPALANVNSRAWGNFTRFGKGDGNLLDTFTWLLSVDSVVLDIDVSDGVVDRDRDGLLDAEETCVYNTDPALEDTDGDSLTDGDEVLIYGTDPLLEDTDWDGTHDRVEIVLLDLPRDTDGDGIIDALDTDDDDDGILSVDEAFMDSDGDGRLDPYDEDDDGDGVPTVIEGDRDTDGDGFPDRLDADDDGDRLLTKWEDADRSGTPLDDDTDGDGLPNYIDTDDDGDSVPTTVEGFGDAFGNGIQNHLDPDDDEDGVPTILEDPDGDGDPTNDDTDGDGFANYLDHDDDGDTLLTPIEDWNGNGDPTDDDSDGDGVPDYLDADDDDDGLLTEREDLNGDYDPRNDDSDSDGIPDFLDNDDDNDGVPSLIEGAGDTDRDGVPDYLDDDSDGDGLLDADEGEADTDGDGILDFQDDDDDNDGVPSADEAGLDTDQDGTADPYDDDDDGDGLTTAEELEDAAEHGDDPDDDGVPSWLDTDSDDDGESDRDEGRGDVNDNGIPNYLDPYIPDVEVWYEGGCGGCSGTGSTPAPWLATALLALGFMRRRR
ncbi:MAG: MYXO-CTERM domain-containing protein [Myxococcota bacterium]|jgi:MYXO-CTERM domain-containing protein